MLEAPARRKCSHFHLHRTVSLVRGKALLPTLHAQRRKDELTTVALNIRASQRVTAALPFEHRRVRGILNFFACLSVSVAV